MVSDDSADRPSWMLPAEPSNGKPLWNQTEDDLLVGQYVLVGITYVASDDKAAITHAQFHGEITKANEKWDHCHMRGENLVRSNGDPAVGPQSVPQSKSRGI
jgi:hypothetical protein